MSGDQWPTPGDWAELGLAESANAVATAPPGYCWYGSKLGPVEPEAGKIAELIHSYLRDRDSPL